MACLWHDLTRSGQVGLGLGPQAGRGRDPAEAPCVGLEADRKSAQARRSRRGVRGMRVSAARAA